ALEVVVDDDAVVEQQLHRQRAHGRGRGQLQRGVHVLGHGGGRAAQGDLLGALLLRLGVLAVLGLAGGGRRLGRGGRGLRGGSGGLRRGGGLGRGLGGGRLGRGGGGLRGGGLRGGAGRGGRPGRVRARGRRGRGAHRGRGRGRARLVVREEVPPGSVHRVRVLEVLLIDLVDEPLVGTEGRRRVLPRLVGVGREVRVTGGLWRHGVNRPLPLHKMMDSGNQGYAPEREKVRSGPGNVMEVTS